MNVVTFEIQDVFGERPQALQPTAQIDATTRCIRVRAWPTAPISTLVDELARLHAARRTPLEVTWHGLDLHYAGDSHSFVGAFLAGGGHPSVVLSSKYSHIRIDEPNYSAKTTCVRADSGARFTSAAEHARCLAVGCRRTFVFVWNGHELTVTPDSTLEQLHTALDAAERARR